MRCYWEAINMTYENFGWGGSFRAFARFEASGIALK